MKFLKKRIKTLVATEIFKTENQWKTTQVVSATDGTRHTGKRGLRTLERTEGPRTLRSTKSLRILERILAMRTLKRTLSLRTLERILALRTLKRSLSLRTLKGTLSLRILKISLSLRTLIIIINLFYVDKT